MSNLVRGLILVAVLTVGWAAWSAKIAYDDQASAAQQLTQATKRRKAEELAQKGFEALTLARRNQYVARCREDGNYPLLFIDKIVCVKPESIAWVKYDDNPEQDTSQGGESSQ